MAFRCQLPRVEPGKQVGQETSSRPPCHLCWPKISKILASPAYFQDWIWEPASWDRTLLPSLGKGAELSRLHSWLPIPLDFQSICSFSRPGGLPEWELDRDSPNILEKMEKQHFPPEIIVLGLFPVAAPTQARIRWVHCLSTLKINALRTSLLAKLHHWPQAQSLTRPHTWTVSTPFLVKWIPLRPIFLKEYCML